MYCKVIAVVNWNTNTEVWGLSLTPDPFENRLCHLFLLKSIHHCLCMTISFDHICLMSCFPDIFPFVSLHVSSLHYMCFVQRAWKLPYIKMLSHVSRYNISWRIKSNLLTLRLKALNSIEGTALSEQQSSLHICGLSLFCSRLLCSNAAGYNWLFAQF